MSDIKQQLKEAAQLSILANRISEIQEKNLKSFPFVFFDAVQTVVIDYDLGHGIDEQTKEVHHKSYVEYRLTLDVDQNKRALDKRMAALEASVRAVFWKDVTVRVLFNGKKVFESENGK